MATITTPAVFISGARVLKTNRLPYNTPALYLGRVWRTEAKFAESAEFPYKTTDTSGYYKAVVKQNNVPLVGCRIGIYWRDSMQLIATVLSGANGEFRFDGLIPDINRYFAIALDPEGGVLQNALIYDRLTPIK